MLVTVLYSFIRYLHNINIVSTLPLTVTYASEQRLFFTHKKSNSNLNLNFSRTKKSCYCGQCLYQYNKFPVYKQKTVFFC